MKFYQALQIDPDIAELACFVGAGGKTTAMFTLAKELYGLNKRVLVTTTTAIFYPGQQDCDTVLVSSEPSPDMFANVHTGSITCAGRQHTGENKLLGFDAGFVDRIFADNLFDYVLVEADGSKHRPIKAPLAHEPVIPDAATKTVGVIGMDCLAKPITAEWVHRPEQFCSITGAVAGDAITEYNIAELICAAEGLFKSVPPGCHRYLLLNKTVDQQREQAARTIIDQVKREGAEMHGYITADMKKGIVTSKA